MFTYAKSEQKQASKNTVQKKETEKKVYSPNLTGIPDATKTRLENLSGFSFDDVCVHYNSGKPAQLQALAYTQGNQVYVAPGQEKHLGYELGHVVQQKEGRVRQTGTTKGIPINDDFSLESDADNIVNNNRSANKYTAPVIQMKLNGVLKMDYTGILYHGTSRKTADAIHQNGPGLFGNSDSELGSGFYMTEAESHALSYGKRKDSSDPAVLRFSITEAKGQNLSFREDGGALSYDDLVALVKADGNKTFNEIDEENDFLRTEYGDFEDQYKFTKQGIKKLINPEISIYAE